MKTHVCTSGYGVGAFMICLLTHTDIHAQSDLTIQAAAGGGQVMLQNAGVLDIADPYIKSIPQYTVGVSYEKALSNHFSMLAGVQFASRGFGVREEFGIDLFGVDIPVSASIETRLHYLEVPLAVKYYLRDHGVMPYVSAGINTAYAVSGKINPKAEVIIPWSLPSIPLDLNDDIYQRYEVSATAGTGVVVPVSESGAFHFSVSYRHGLSDMLNDPVTDFTIRSNGFTAGVGYTFIF